MAERRRKKKLNDRLYMNISYPVPGQRLRLLVLSQASSLRSGSLELAVQSCPSLESINVSHCYVLGDHEAAAISLAAGLRDLKLVKCLGVTNVGLAKIAVRCGGLRSLNLKWCLKITDLGIDLLSKKYRDLKVTNNSLHSIASLPKLEDLSMVGCSFFDDDGLDYLGNGSPSLQETRLLALIEGVLAANIFDWGSCTCVDLYLKGTIIEIYRMSRKKMQRPWRVDDFDAFKEMMLGFGDKKPKPHNRALLFVDNSGANTILGMLPLARELLRRGTEVVLVANSLPALNDMTAMEILEIVAEAAKMMLEYGE